MSLDERYVERANKWAVFREIVRDRFRNEDAMESERLEKPDFSKWNEFDRAMALKIFEEELALYLG